MKIQKVVQINGVGKFHNYSSHGDMNFSDITLIYGENGKGKTTLSTIFRSLKTGDVTYLNEKKCAGESAPISIKVILGNNHIAQYSESSGAWNQVNHNIEIFDSYHVNNNVYSGDHVDHTHRKNLYYLVIGEQGVQMAQEIEQIDSDIKNLNDPIKVLEGEIKCHILSKCSLDTFVQLPEIVDVDQKISEINMEIKSLEEASYVKEAGVLSKIDIQSLKFVQLECLLGKSLETVSEEAKSHVIDHCLSLGSNAESWVKQGIDFLGSYSTNSCPFCQQKIDQLDIIQHFQAYFTQAYADLKQEIASFSKAFESSFPHKKLLEIQSALSSNSSLAKFWGNYFPNVLDNISFELLEEARETIFSLVKKILSQKTDKPLDIIRLPEDLSTAIATYQQIRSRYDVYNAQVEKINEQITAKKTATQTGNLTQAKSTKLTFEDSRVRYTVEVKELCDSYISKKSEQSLLKTKKQEKSDQLKAYSENVLDKYRTTINAYLAKFGTEFEIVDPKTSLQGGKPSANYMLRINNVTVPLGTTETVGEPCFRTILSDGDKNSLAFAFFMAQLKLDPNIAEKTLIIDDPITSLDIHRKNRTYQEVREISKLAKQTIILSHDAHFLKLFWEGLPNVRTFQIVREGKQSIICDWDIHKETLPSYLQDYFRLENYLTVGDNDLRGVARCIRPVLEGNLRFRFPKSFGVKEWLGDFLEKIRDASPTSRLAKIQPFLPELSAICAYSSRFHHQQNPLADKEEAFDSELNPYVTRTLSLLEQI